jgi:hypothetical protein
MVTSLLTRGGGGVTCIKTNKCYWATCVAYLDILGTGCADA